MSCIWVDPDEKRDRGRREHDQGGREREREERLLGRRLEMGPQGGGRKDAALAEEE